MKLMQVGALSGIDAILLSLLLTTIIIVGSTLKIQAQSGIDYYSPNEAYVVYNTQRMVCWGRTEQCLMEIAV